MPDVSVIIPTYNRRELLIKAVSSALDQTFPPLEVLVCDDGSTDDSRMVIEAIGDPRVRWIEGPRGGRPAIPRNRGIRESRGEWLAFLDNDDEWQPDKLERQLALVEKLDLRAVCSNALRFVPGQGSAGHYLSWGHERISFDDLLCVNHVICSSVLVHRSLLTDVRGFPEGEQLKALEDYALWLRIATMTDIAFVADPLVVYRDDAASSIRRGGSDYWRQRQTVFTDFQKWGRLNKVNKRYLSQVRSRLLRDKFNKVMTILFSSTLWMKRALTG